MASCTVRARRTRGSALVMLLLALFAVATVLLASAYALDAAGAGAQDAARETARLAAAKARLLQWYAQHLDRLDAADAFPYAPDAVLREAGLADEPGLRFAAGPRGTVASRGGWRYRPLAIWLAPRADDRTSFDAAGVLRPDPQLRASVVFSSEPLQRAAYAASEETLRTLATMAELRFLARLRADPDHDSARNWFRPADCGLVDDDFPCTEAGRPRPIADLMASGRPFGAAFSRPLDTPPSGQRDGLASNAWGGANLFDNAPRNGEPQSPHVMRFSTITPFGDRIEIVAVGPVE